MVTSSKKVLQLGVLLSLASANANANATNLAADVNAALGVTQSDVQNLQIDGSIERALFVDIAIEGIEYQLQLYPHSIRSQNYQVLEQQEDGSLVRVAPAPLRTLRGSLVGAPDSLVAGALLDDGLYARIQMNGTEWWVQPIASLVPAASATQYAIYNSTWVQNPGGECGSDSLAGNVQRQEFSMPGVGQTYGTLKVCELACDMDYEYYQDYGSTSAVTNRINLVINTMNLQYENEVGITHEIGTIIVRSSSNDPYTSSDAGTLLNQFRDHWNSNQTGVHRDVAHMFTGRNLNGGTIGIAWLGVICSNNLGYGLVESNFSGNFSCSTDLSAHEIGHNWNADHCTCTSNTMNPYITCANTFSASLTRPDIINHRNSRTCLSNGGAGGRDILFFDGFESGNFSAGGWVLQNNRPRIKPAAHRTGSYGARLRRDTWIEKSVSTLGYQAIRIEFSRRTRNLDAGETFFAEYYNGSSWVNVETIGDTGNAWADVSFDLGAAANNNANFKIRFTVDASEGIERGDLDEVAVTGLPL